MLLNDRAVLTLLGSLVAAPCSFAQPPMPPRVQLVQELRLDGATEDFSVFGQIALNARGMIAIAMRQDHQVWVYDASGKRLAKLGRRGDGPGEFGGALEGSLLSAGWVGDTVWAVDFGRRISYFKPTGELLRTVSQPTSLEPIADRSTPRGQPQRYLGRFASGFALHGVLADGSLLGNALLVDTTLPRGQGRRAQLRVSPTGEPRVLAEEVQTTQFNPLVYRPVTFFAPDGSGFARLVVDSMVVTGGTFTITKMSLTGERIFRRSFPYAGVRLTQGAIDSALARMMPARGSSNDEPALRQMMAREQDEARKSIPPVRMPIRTFLLGQDGTTWIHLEPTTTGQTTYVLDARGNFVHTLQLPAGQYVAAASRTHVWVRETDADGLPSLIRYRLRTPICAPAACR